MAIFIVIRAWTLNKGFIIFYWIINSIFQHTGEEFNWKKNPSVIWGILKKTPFSVIYKLMTHFIIIPFVFVFVCLNVRSLHCRRTTGRSSPIRRYLLAMTTLRSTRSKRWGELCSQIWQAVQNNSKNERKLHTVSQSRALQPASRRAAALLCGLLWNAHLNQ